jgi:predicted permease
MAYDEAGGKRFYSELMARARALPGVESAALVFSVPLFHDRFVGAVYPEGQTLGPGEPAGQAGYNIADSSLFRTLRIPILQGRGFNQADDERAAGVAVISRAMAERFWPRQDALGKRFKVRSAGAPWLTVVGVARDARFSSPMPGAEPYFYVPLSQHYTSRMTLQVRSPLPPETLARELEGRIHALAPDLPLHDVRTMEAALGGTTGFFLFRVGAGLAAGLGLLALFLTAIGVYGVVSYSATRRTHEIGLRMALGAESRQILRMVLGRGLKAVAIGVSAGAALALPVSQVAGSLLVGVSPFDPITYAFAALLLGGVTLLAAYIPARRAMRLDPMTALRHE